MRDSKTATEGAYPQGKEGAGVEGKATWAERRDKVFWNLQTSKAEGVLVGRRLC